MGNQQAGTFRRPIVYGSLGLVLLNLLMFGDILFNGQGRVLSSPKTDLFLHFTAWREFAFNQLRQGHLTLWNPHYLCGTPFLGNFESAILYPPNWFYLILPLAFAINVGIILHVFWAGFFTYLWAYQRGLHPLSCFLAGTIFMFGGAYFLHVFAGHLPNLCAMVWAPLIFLSIDGLLEKISVRWVLVGIFAVSMQILAGHPQYVYFTVIIGGIYVLLNLKGNASKFKVVGSVVSFYAASCLITAAQLWTGLQAMSECGRNIPMDFHSASSFSFPPENLLTLFLPNFFGNLTTQPYWGRWFLWEVSLFIGVTSFFLVLLSVFSTDSKKRKWAFTTALIAFVFSMGSFTPLAGFLYDFLPGFNGLRGICKFDFLASLFLAILAGIGFDYLIKSQKAPRWLVFVPAFLGLIGILLGFIIYLSEREGLDGFWGKWFITIHWLKNALLALEPEQKIEYLKQAGLGAAFSLWVGAGICFVLSLLFGWVKKSRKVVYVISALAVLELFTFARMNRPTFLLADLQKKFDQIRSFDEKEKGEFRVYGTGSASMAAGGCDIWEDEPMVLGRYGRFVCFSQGLQENQLFSVLPIFKRFHPVFGMLRLKYRILLDQDPIQVYPMPYKTLPRMLLLNQWEVMPENQKILPALFDPGFDPSQKVYLEQNPIPTPKPGKVDGKVEWKNLSTEAVEVTAEIPKACLLLVTDNFSSGWRAEALPDSVQTFYRVMPANYFLQAVPLSAGKHHFLLEYRPGAFVVGKWISILSSFLYVGILVLHLRKKTIYK